MTIRPRHYARLLVDGATADQLAARVDALSALGTVRALLAELMVLPATHPKVARILAEAEIDDLTRSIVTELGITGRLNWLPAIARSVEQLVIAGGQPGIAHVELAEADAIADADLALLLTPLVGSLGAIRTTIMPAQLGGITIQVADQRLDASLDGRLKKLRSALTKGMKS